MVTINSSVSQNSWGGVFSINESNRLMSESLERLRTGFRIASAKDDPSGFVDALDLSRRISSHEAAINNNQSTYSELAQFEDLQRSIIDTLNEIRAELVKGDRKSVV